MRLHRERRIAAAMRTLGDLRVYSVDSILIVTLPTGRFVGVATYVEDEDGGGPRDGLHGLTLASWLVEPPPKPKRRIRVSSSRRRRPSRPSGTARVAAA